MILVNGEDVIKTAAAQMTGVVFTLSDGSQVSSTDVAALESFKVTDLGSAVVDPISGDLVKATAESFFNSLVSVISRIQVDARAYKGDLNDFMIQDSEWGGFFERVYFELADIIDDPKWNLARNAGLTPPKVDYADEDHRFYPLKAHAKLFRKAIPLLTPISMPTDQLKEACRNEAEMQSIVNGIIAAVNRTIEAGLQSLRHMMAQDAIAISIANTGTAINLLATYQTETGDTTVTVSNWQNSEAFMRHALQKISETRDNLSMLSTAFNDHTVAMASDPDQTKLILLNKFDKLARFGVRADTFHKENLAIGDYSTTTSWQGINAGSGATDFDFASTSKIMIAADSDNTLGIGTSAFTQSGVVGLLFDRYALGMSPFKRKVTSQYTAIADFLNMFHHTLVGATIDITYPIVAFYIATP